jgi:hypothetical protein
MRAAKIPCHSRFESRTATRLARTLAPELARRLLRNLGFRSPRALRQAQGRRTRGALHYARAERIPNRTADRPPEEIRAFAHRRRALARPLWRPRRRPSRSWASTTSSPAATSRTLSRPTRRTRAARTRTTTDPPEWARRPLPTPRLLLAAPRGRSPGEPSGGRPPPFLATSQARRNPPARAARRRRGAGPRGSPQRLRALLKSPQALSGGGRLEALALEGLAQLSPPPREAAESRVISGSDAAYKPRFS